MDVVHWSHEWTQLTYWPLDPLDMSNEHIGRNWHNVSNGFGDWSTFVSLGRQKWQDAHWARVILGVIFDVNYWVCVFLLNVHWVPIVHVFIHWTYSVHVYTVYIHWTYSVHVYTVYIHWASNGRPLDTCLSNWHVYSVFLLDAHCTWVLTCISQIYQKTFGDWVHCIQLTIQWAQWTSNGKGQPRVRFSPTFGKMGMSIDGHAHKNGYKFAY